MPEQQHVVSLKGSSAAEAVAVVLSALYGWHARCVSQKAGFHNMQAAATSLLILTCLDGIDQLLILPKLRLDGFRGPVLIVSDQQIATLKERHKILRWSPGSREAFAPPWLLIDLLEKAIPLEALGEGTLLYLQQHLGQRTSHWREGLERAVQRLAAGHEPLAECLGELETVFDELRLAAPCAAHDEYSSFRRLMSDIKEEGRFSRDHNTTAKKLVRRLLDRLEETSEIL